MFFCCFFLFVLFFFLVSKSGFSGQKKKKLKIIIIKKKKNKKTTHNTQGWRRGEVGRGKGRRNKTQELKKQRKKSKRTATPTQTRGTNRGTQEVIRKVPWRSQCPARAGGLQAGEAGQGEAALARAGSGERVVLARSRLVSKRYCGIPTGTALGAALENRPDPVPRP